MKDALCKKDQIRRIKSIPTKSAKEPEIQEIIQQQESNIKLFFLRHPD